MTEKRFLYVLDNDEDTIYDLFEKNILSKKDIEDKMNAFYEENKQLKQQIKVENKSKLDSKEKNDEFEETGVAYILWVLKKTIDEFDELHKMYVEQIEENNELKQKVDFYKDFQKDARELAKDNEQLKQELAIYRKLMSCSNCKYHNYDWYDDGDEFEVCDKGNDVTDGICKDWEEIE